MNYIWMLFVISSALALFMWQRARERALLNVLREVHESLQFAYDSPDFGMRQGVILMMHRPQTMFDFIMDIRDGKPYRKPPSREPTP
jgi:hypothetical protein